jgi:oxygen-independent coproporphyrinogen III oxidase
MALLPRTAPAVGRRLALPSHPLLPAALGILRNADDARRDAAIEALLCHGTAQLDPDLAEEIAPALAPFIARHVASLNETRLTIASRGLPYSRSIAALLDPYRAQAPSRFSSAV